eukprot:1177436-Prorocentrum_minimum.AAC.2
MSLVFDHVAHGFGVRGLHVECAQVRLLRLAPPLLVGEQQPEVVEAVSVLRLELHRPEGVIKGVIRGVIQGVIRGVEAVSVLRLELHRPEGVVRGVIQGVIKGVIQGVIQGVVKGVTRG